MSFPRYPEYKDSGVEWLGEVPEDWAVTPIKRFGRLKGGAGFPHAEQGLETEELPFHKVNALARARSGVLEESENTISRATAKGLRACVFPSGTLVFAKVGAALLLGRICVLDRAACIDNNMMGLVIENDGVDATFAAYALKVVRFDLIANPGAVPSLNEGQIGNYQLVLPSPSEQVAIAAFLDRETGKIDALVAEQKKLIALLKEKRRALISHAVTKGLDPNAPMKDFGIEWLGQVPLHWDVVTLRRVVLGFEQGWSPECEARSAEDDEWGVLKAGCANGGQFHPEEHKALPITLKPRSELEVHNGDVLMSRASGSPQLIGSVACLEHPPARLMLSDKIFRLRLASDIRPQFFAQAMGSAPLRTQIEQAIGGAEGLANNLPQARIKDFWLAVPSAQEQREIECHIKQAVGHFDELEQQTQGSINLLKERRAALISAAVTGKIDVRSVVAVDNHAEEAFA